MMETAMPVATRTGTRQAWDTIAPSYDRTNTTTQLWLGGEAVRRVGLGKDMRFLDVAAGSGALSIPAARAGASVVAIDQSPVMLDLLRARGVDERLEIETRVMDGHALALPDNTFDVVGSQFGVMLFPDMPAGIREMARVAKPGGRVMVIAYGDPHAIEFLSWLVRSVQSARPEFDGPPADPPPLELQLADPRRLHRELQTARLRDIDVRTIVETTRFPSGYALWDWLVCSNPIVGTLLDGLTLSDAEVVDVQQTLERMVRERAGNESEAGLTNPVHIGIGIK